MAHILVVDDDPLILELMKEILAADGHHTECAADGLEALEKVKTYKPELVITDIMMPNLNGLSLIRLLKESHSHVKIIAASGGGPSARVDYLEAAACYGASRILQKPFKFREVSHCVNSVLPS